MPIQTKTTYLKENIKIATTENRPIGLSWLDLFA